MDIASQESAIRGNPLGVEPKDTGIGRVRMQDPAHNADLHMYKFGSSIVSGEQCRAEVAAAEDAVVHGDAAVQRN